MEEGVTRDNVLALDIARHTGYHSTKESGTWNFREGKQRNDNKEHGAFRKTLVEFIQKYGIKRIVAEDVSVNNHYTDIRKLSEFRGILLEVCDTLGLPEPAFVNPVTLKHWATGDGSADKQKMIEACIRRWHITPCDDNEADSVHLFMYYVKKFDL